MTKTIFHKKKEDCYKEAVRIIIESIEKTLAEKEYAVLAIPGGRNVAAIFNILTKEDILWDKIHIFMVDERLVGIDDEQSNFKLANDSFIKNLIKTGKLQEENIHPFIVNANEKDKGIKKYEEELKKVGGKYDIVLLSAGEDGHVGALYPKHHSVNDESDFFITINDSPKAPAERMSSSKNLLLKSSIGIIIFIGNGKKEAYEKYIDKGLEIEDCPAKIVDSLNESYVLTDIIKEED